MADLITGYQYSPADGRFIGEYTFPNNLDRKEIHLPPFTTLVQPPVIGQNDVAFWRGNAWELVSVLNETNIPPIDDYLMITDGFIDFMKSAGLWTAEHQTKRNEALAKKAQADAELEALLAQRNAGVNDAA